MFVHIVFFKFYELTSRTEAKVRLESMRGKVPTLRFIEVGEDLIDSPRSWELVLITHFDDRAGYEAYTIDPIHVAVLTWLKSVVQESATVDYLQES